MSKPKSAASGKVVRLACSEAELVANIKSGHALVQCLVKQLHHYAADVNSDHRNQLLCLLIETSEQLGRDRFLAETYGLDCGEYFYADLSPVDMRTFLFDTLKEIASALPAEEES